MGEERLEFRPCTLYSCLFKVFTRYWRGGGALFSVWRQTEDEVIAKEDGAHKTLIKSIGYDATNGKDKCLLRTLTVAAKLLVGLAIRSSASLPCCTTWNPLPFRLAVPVDSGGGYSECVHYNHDRLNCYNINEHTLLKYFGAD